MSKAELQRSAQLSPSTYYRLERGDIGQISVRTMYKLASVLRLPLDQLLSEHPDYPAAADHSVAKRQLATAIDGFLEERLRAVYAPVLIPVFDSVFAAEHSNAENLVLRHIAIPHHIAAKAKKVIAIELWDIFHNELTQGRTLVVIAHEPKFRSKLEKRKGLVLVTIKGDEDLYGHGEWNEKRGFMKLTGLEPIGDGEPYEFMELEFEDIKRVCPVLMLVSQ